MSGAINMLDHPDLSDVGTMRRSCTAFEEKAQLIDLLSRLAAERGVQVMIGERESADGDAGVQLDRVHLHLS